MPVHGDTNVLEVVLDQLAQAVILCDPNLVITGINRAAEQLLSIRSETALGRSCSEVFRCHDCKPECGIRAGMEQGPKTPGSVLRICGSGNHGCLATVQATQFSNSRGEVAGVVAWIRNVSDQAPVYEHEFIAEAPAMKELESFVRRVAESEATTILLEGENGTGKDLIAKTTHFLSARRAEPFIEINCAAIPETLLESELFGYEKGAFTDARSQKRGIFELADRGTLFLDEIGEISLVLQAKLLRVLEEQRFRRLGGLKDIQVDVRIIVATNKNLRDAVKAGAFRQDLYFRLNVIQIVIPPLRQRLEDILPIARHFIDRYNRKFKRQVQGLSERAAALLTAYSWPGNVRELRNAIERAIILEESSLITAAKLPMTISQPASADALSVSIVALPSPENLSLREHEESLLLRALQKTGGNTTQSARLLNISRDTMRYRMKKFGLSKTCL